MARTRDNVAVSIGAADDHGYEESNKSGMTLLVVIFSLIFVAVFGGALVGGIVSGDPDGTFFTVIIITSVLAIVVAVIFGIRKAYCKKSKHYDVDQKDLRGTFTRSEEENHHYGEDPEYDGYYEERYEPQPTPVNARINEIKAGSVAGDMSALSPTTLEMETDQRTTPGKKRSGRTPRRESSGRGLFDFATVSEGSERRSRPRREDPPDSSDAPSYTESNNQRLMDPPTGPIDSDQYWEEEERDDNEEEDEDEEEIDGEMSSSSHHTRKLSSSSHHTSTSRRLVDEDNYDEFGGEEVEPKMSAKKSQKSKRDVPPPPPPPPRTEPPLSTLSSKSKRSKPPATPMSEAGSAVSSIFFKPFSAVFGKKRTASEAGVSETTAYQKGSDAGSGFNTNATNDPKAIGEKSKKPNGSEVGVSSKTPMGANRPPKPMRKPSSSQSSNVGGSKNLETINAGAPVPTKRRGSESEIGRYTPATPTGSTFSRGAASSVAPSDFRSTAGSSVFSAGVASSTFDPQAHQAALKRLQRNSAIIGAQRVNDDPEVFFEEDDEESEHFETGTAYDVFAPSGPIGIVVDTTQAGPIVHSLKKSSPMQGLISPGDLIVALDDKDVRRMDAATLTKLMAKKSQQTERKFTLMALDDYAP